MKYKFIAILLFFASTLIAQDFELKSIGGKTYHINMTDETLRIKEFPNKVIMIDFFSSTCVPCIKEFPELIKFQKTFQDSVQIIGIESGSKKDDEQMREFAKEYNLNYPIIGLKESGGIIQFAMSQTDWVGALPYKLLYDHEGVFSHKMYGSMTWEMLTGALGDL
jgi:thiol-disulfide isomerase/thioredoxin